MSEMREVIGVQVIKPWRRGDRLEKKVYYCSQLDCPLLAAKQCVNVSLFDSCNYGVVRRVAGFTSRAAGYGKQLEEWKAGEVPMGMPPRIVTVIGEYVWLPYSHINIRDGMGHIPFVGHAGFFSATPLIKVTDFTPEVVVALANAKPQALMGGEIRSYQTESVPKFLLDLSLVMPEIFEAAVKIDESIAVRAGAVAEQDVTLQLAAKFGYTGMVTYNGKEGFLYSDSTIEFNGGTLAEFPGCKVKLVMVKPPLTDKVRIRRDSREFVKIMTEANKSKNGA